MGGRGSYSSSHGGIVHQSRQNVSLNKFGKKEERKDIRNLFINELGFKEIYGTQKIPTAQLASLAIQLKKSEKIYHTLRDNHVVLSTISNNRVKGAAAEYADGTFAMFINPKIHSSVSGARKMLKGEQKSGFKTETDKKITNDFSYTARHEYGHLTQYAATKKTRKNASIIKKEIQNIAGTTSNPSGYGGKNSKEYFAESFASMTGGKPNSQGKAIKKWLNKNVSR